MAVSLADVHVQRHVPSERLENGCSSGALVIRSENRFTVGSVQLAGAQAPVAGTPIRETVRRPSTLLGPEGTATLCGTLGQDRPEALERVPKGRDRPYLENCTVDASIISVVAKLVRAHGGCLGTRSR